MIRMHVDPGHTPWRSMPARSSPHKAVFVMPTDTRSKPPPTPHPDRPSKPGAIRAPSSSPKKADPEPPDSVDREDAVYDSCTDELDEMLSQPLSEPDPALQSSSAREMERNLLAKTGQLLLPLATRKSNPGPLSSSGAHGGIRHRQTRQAPSGGGFFP